MSKIQNLLAQRRFNVVEMMHERDKTAKAALVGHIAQLDLDIERLQDLEAVTEWDDMPTKEYVVSIAISDRPTRRINPDRAITQVCPIISDDEAIADLKARGAA